jgi:hypothetical protein
MTSGYCREWARCDVGEDVLQKARIQVPKPWAAEAQLRNRANQ